MKFENGKGFIQLGNGVPSGVAQAVANPEGKDIWVEEVIVVGAGGTSIDIGIAANATTSSDNLIDGLNPNTTKGSNISNPGTNGASRRIWGASQFLNLTHTANLTGKVLVKGTVLD